MQATRLLDVDTVRYPVHFQGFHAPLHVWLQGGEHVTLAPWTCGEHLRALGRHLRPQGEGVVLDEQGFCRELLARSGVEGPRAEELEPLALWWAAGGGVASGQAGEGGWLTLETCRVRLRPWTAGERLRALGRCLLKGPEGQRSLDMGAYLAAMLEASVCEVLPASVQVQALDAASTMALLEAVSAVNVPDEAWLEQLAGLEQATTSTLRLCRELGWTPSQVWATPAHEVDLLLRLLDREREARRPAAPARSAPAVPSRLADLPDAIVIQIEDDPA